LSGAALWTATEAAAATGAETAETWNAEGISIDSRTIVPGDLFIALEGPNFDGHEFLAQAFAEGAVAAVVHRRPAEPVPGPLLVVDDTMTALEALGRAARTRCVARVVAVTGSVGKTGTKEALRLCLAVQGPTHANVANLNNQWGVPLSLARMPRDSAYAVFELGMNHPGELGPLSRLVRPHAVIVTNVEAVHLEFFDSVAAIADAKAEAFEGLEPDGVAIVNLDNAHSGRLVEAARGAGAARIVGFGTDPQAEVRLIKVVPHSECCCISATIGDQPVTYKVGAPGRHWAMNSLAVLAAIQALGGDLGLAALELAQLSALEGRGARHTVALGEGSFVLIDDSYNASPASMRAAFDTLADAPVGRGGRRLAVLGDMLELGSEASKLHRELAADLAAAGVDLVFTAGAAMAALHQALPVERRGLHASTSGELIEPLRAALSAGDAALVKGSLGSRMGIIVEALLADDQTPSAAVNG
jgi:UDP-N-acetylmuramoyl-tripeptide--D-alanyl-D-alanine ligase